MQSLDRDTVKKQDKNKNANYYKRAFEAIASDLEKEAYECENVVYLSTYFIFDRGTNSIIHFNIKEIPGFKFGIWWNTEFDNQNDKDLKGYLFCQYEDNIDKFKPSASEICEEITVCFDNGLNNPIASLNIYFFKFIKENPELAWYRDNFWTNLNYEYVDKNEALKEFEKYKKHKLLEKKLIPELDAKYLKMMKDYADRLIEEYEIIDRGDNWSPRYELLTWDEKTRPGVYTFINESKEEHQQYQQMIGRLTNRAMKNDILWLWPMDNIMTITTKEKYDHLKETEALLDLEKLKDGIIICKK